MFKRLIVLATLAVSGGAAAAADADHAVAFVYHRFGENAAAATNITLAQFDAHIAHLSDGGFVVRPLGEIVEALRAGVPLDDRTVAITVDDAFASVRREALPRLKAAGFPATIFVSTASVDAGLAGFMSWDDIRQALDDGFDIGAHSVSHAHLADMPDEDALHEITHSNRRFKEELGFTPPLFAYPYGEASLALREIVAAAGYKAAFGQHSGVLHGTEDPFYLPRFALNERYGGISRFRTLASAKPLLATDVTPRDMLLDASRNPPAFGFTVDPSVGDLSALACYSGEDGRLALQHLGRRIEARFPKRLGPGRRRINCTLPAGGGRWRWFGRQFYVPDAAG